MHDDTRQILTAIEEARIAAHEQARRTRALIREEAQAAGSLLGQILKQLERITTPVVHKVIVVVSGQSIHIPGLRDFQGEDMSFTVPRDHADEPFTLDPITVSDSEGPVDKTFTETLASDNTDVVSIVGDAPSQSFHFGTFGGANVTRKVTIDGQEFIVAAAVFNVTPGALTVSGNINVPGLTPDA